MCCGSAKPAIRGLRGRKVRASSRRLTSAGPATHSFVPPIGSASERA
jgi:hypothetical protein